MATDYIQRIKQYYKLLLRTLDLEGGLLDKLLFSDVITPAVYESIQSVHAEQKNVDLLRFLITVPDAEVVLPKFVEALNDSDYLLEHVANILEAKESGKQPLSQERYDLLTARNIDLRLVIDPSEEFLSKLVSDGLFTKQDRSRINVIKCFDDKAADVVNIISKKSDCCFDKFIEALSEMGQEHVVTLLLGHGEKRPIRKEWRKKLVINRSKIRENMTIQNDTLLSESMSEGVFSEYDQQRILGEKTHDSKVECLLQILMRKSEDRYVRFIDALCRSSQRHVANMMYGLNLQIELVPKFSETTSEESRLQVESELIDKLTKVFLTSDFEVEKNLKQNGRVQACTSMIKDIGVEVADIRTGSIIIVFRCSVESKSKLHYDSFKRLSVFIREVFCPLYSEQGLQSLEIVLTHSGLNKLVEQLNEVILTEAQTKNLFELKEQHISKIRVDEDLLKKLPVTRIYLQAIEAEKCQEDKARLLLSFVERQSRRTYQNLIMALKETHQYIALELLAYGGSSVLVKRTSPYVHTSSRISMSLSSEELISANKLRSGYFSDFDIYSRPSTISSYSPRRPEVPETKSHSKSHPSVAFRGRGGRLSGKGNFQIQNLKVSQKELKPVFQHAEDAALADTELTPSALARYLNYSTETEINELFIQLYDMEAIESILAHSKECTNSDVVSSIPVNETKWQQLLMLCKFQRSDDSLVRDILSSSQKLLQLQWKLLKLKADNEFVNTRKFVADLKEVINDIDSTEVWKERFELLTKEMTTRDWKVVIPYSHVCTCLCGKEIVRGSYDWNIELFRRKPSETQIRGVEIIAITGLAETN